LADRVETIGGHTKYESVYLYSPHRSRANRARPRTQQERASLRQQRAL